MNQIQDAFVQAFQVFMYGAIPVLAVVALAGTIVSALQSATAIQEPSLGYAARVAALAALAYAFFPALAQSILTLAEQLYQ